MKAIITLNLRFLQKRLFLSQKLFSQTFSLSRLFLSETAQKYSDEKFFFRNFINQKLLTLFAYSCVQVQVLQKCYQNLVANFRHCNKLAKFAILLHFFKKCIIGKNVDQFVQKLRFLKTKEYIKLQ